MKLCYSANQAYLPGLLMSALSAVFVTTGPLDIYILTGDFHEIRPKFLSMEQKDVEFMESVLRLYKPDVTVNLIDVSIDHKEEIMSYVNVGNKYSVYSLLRLFIDQYIPEGKVLHIDVDAMVLKDLAPLYNTDMGDNQIAMALDWTMPVSYFDYYRDYRKIRKEYPGDSRKDWKKYSKNYCNAGVILFNLDNIKGSGKFEKCRQIVKKYKMNIPDQSTMNKVFGDRKLILDGKYDEMKKIKEDTVIRHYTMLPKPWEDLDSFHRKRGDYQFDDAILLARAYLKQREEGKEVSLIDTDKS